MTTLDLYHSRLYASQYLTKLKFDKLKLKYPQIFDHVIVTERQATHLDYYVPPKIARSCLVYEYRFTETGCRKIGCFPFKDSGKLCNKTDSTTVLNYAQRYMFACQPACFNLYPRQIALDTVYKGNKCLLENYMLKLFALKPPGRYNTSLTLDVEDDRLKLTADYCTGNGLVFKDEDCVTTSAQNVGEFFVGTTIYRSCNVALAPTPKPVAAPPPIPPDIETVEQWSGRRIKRSTSPSIYAPDTENEGLELLKQLGEGFLVDMGVTKSVDAVKSVLVDTIPEYLMTKGELHLVTLAAFAEYRLSAQTVVLLMKGLSEILGAVTVAFDVFSIVSMVLDYYDPAGFNRVLTKKTLNDLNNQLQVHFQQVYPEKHITPDFLFPVLDTEPEDKHSVDFINGKVNEYLDALEVNAQGQRLSIQQEHYLKLIQSLRKKYAINWPVIIYTFLSLLGLILCFFTVLFPYIVVLLFFVTLFFQCTYFKIKNVIE